MKSSSGEHFVALDHVRALAIFLVVAWHFTHGANGYPTPFNQAPIALPLALLDEGHTGVSLFMALSGYLFAKLLNGRSLRFGAFLYNRALRLAPLLVVVLSIDAIFTNKTVTFSGFVGNIMMGLIKPVWPNGAWSITIEIHFYVLLPLLLSLFRTASRFVIVIMFALCLRLRLWAEIGEVQSLAYWTLIGRADQFILGIGAFRFRHCVAGRHFAVASALFAFSVFYWWFDSAGGFFNLIAYPSPSPIWIVLPTLEGLAYAIGIAWYDGSFRHRGSGMSKAVAWIGQYSYSIYLLHPFVVFDAAAFIHHRLMDISNFYISILWSILFLICMVPVAYLSFRVIEEPFLRLRRVYIRTGNFAPTSPLGPIAPSSHP